MSISNFKKLPAGFLLSLVIIAVALAFFNRFDNYFYTHPYLGLRMKMKNHMCQEKHKQYDFLAFGDCYNLVGIVPDIIYQKTELKGFNFATHSMETILAAYLMFDNYLAANDKPPAFIIIGFIPRTCATTLKNIKKVNITHLYNFREGNLNLFVREFGVRNTLKFFIPTLKHQWFFENLIFHPFSTKKPDMNEVDEFMKTVYADKGRHVWFTNQEYKGDITDLGEYNFSTVSPFFDRYLRKILDLAMKNGIMVIYNIPTVTPDRNRLYEKHGNMKAYVRYFKSLQKSYPEMVVVYPQDLLNKKQLYVDNFHLNGRGASILSEYLVGRIKELKSQGINRNGE